MERRLIPEEVYENLPPMLSELCSYHEGRDRDMLLLSSIGVISSCLPNIYGIYDGDEVFSNLYVLILAPAASGKGIMMKPVKLVNKIHQKLHEDSLLANLNCADNSGKRSKKKDDESDAKECPPVVVKLLPADISSAEFHAYLASSDHGMLIAESEADTMSKIINGDSWGNYSDVLRKAFQHERISIARKSEKVFVNLEETKLSLVMSGTPGQLAPLIKSAENGLFSRFIFYSFDEIKDFKDVFDTASSGLNRKIEEYQDVLFNAYGALRKMDHKIEFRFTENQQQDFREEMLRIQRVIEKEFDPDFMPSLFRQGLICFRFAMILSATRMIDSVHESDGIICTDADFKNALLLASSLLKHSLYAYEMMTTPELTLEEKRIISRLPDKFSRQQAINVGEGLGIPKRTMDTKLSKWVKLRILYREKQGEYRKHS